MQANTKALDVPITSVRRHRLAKIYMEGVDMNRVIYLIGLIVIVLFIAGYLGIR